MLIGGLAMAKLDISAADKDNPKGRFIKYGRISALDRLEEVGSLRERDVEIFEKADGGNCQVRRAGWQLMAGSKANFLTGKRKIEARPWFSHLVGWMHSNHSLYNLPEDLVVFGEWMGNHTISYPPAFVDRFFVIDVLDIGTRRFLEYIEGRRKLQSLGVEGVSFFNMLFSGRVDQRTVRRLLEEKSDFYDGPKEGLVIKDYRSDPQIFFKVYHPEFAETIVGADGKCDYLTPARYRKCVYVCLERGRREIAHEDIVEEVRTNVRQERGVRIDSRRIRERLNQYIGEGKLKGVLGR